jgi:hypothetical protein
VALIGAAIGPRSNGEQPLLRENLPRLDATMLVPAQPS